MVSVSVQEVRTELARMRAANDSMRRIIDRSVDHLLEIHAFLRTLGPEPLRPRVYADDHPLCCDVPMWLTTVLLSDGPGVGDYTCQVCGKTSRKPISRE